jgi:hypothetical protein
MPPSSPSPSRVAPFDAAIVFMVAGGVLIAMTWTENYGDQSSHDLTQQFTKAWDAIQAGARALAFESAGGAAANNGQGQVHSTPQHAAAKPTHLPTPHPPPPDPCIALLGAIQAMFEAAMYSFVFLWTMAMSPNKEGIKHGLM